MAATPINVFLAAWIKIMGRLILVVHMPAADRVLLEKGERYISTDRLANEVEEFCNHLKLPYQQQFVSIAAYADFIPRGAIADAYGGSDGVHAILEVEQVLPDILIACEDDLQNVAHNGLYHLRKNRRSSQYSSKVHMLSQDLQTREQELYDLANAYVGSHYVEARLFRPLILEDVAAWD